MQVAHANHFYCVFAQQCLGPHHKHKAVRFQGQKQANKHASSYGRNTDDDDDDNDNENAHDAEYDPKVLEVSLPPFVSPATLFDGIHPQTGSFGVVSRAHSLKTGLTP